MRAALEPLIAHRLAQVEKPSQPLTYYPDDSVEGWLGNLGVGWGNIAPEKVPYYLLIVGAPSRIPYQFAQTLDAEYCVGLLDLPDAAAYQRYVRERHRLREGRRDREQERDRLLRHASSLRRCDDAERGLAGDAADGRVAGAAAVGRGASGRERMVLRPAQVRRRRRPAPGARRRADAGRQEAAGAVLQRDARHGLAERPRAAASGAGRAALPGLGRLRRHRGRPLPGRRRRSGRGQRVRRDRVSLRVLRRRHAARGSLRSRARRGAAGNRAQAVRGGVAAAGC